MKFAILFALLISPSGQYAVEAGGPQGETQAVGKVIQAQPSETVQHKGEAKQLPLNLNDTVYVDDVVRTQSTGQVKIVLLDGSNLNVSPRSEMKIVRHDPYAEETAIELPTGELLVNAQSIILPSGSFVVITQTAAIGVGGTSFVVESDRIGKKTQVCCFHGAITVRNINPAIVGWVQLHAGESTTIRHGTPPPGSTPTNPSPTVSTNESQTASFNPCPSDGDGVGGRIYCVGRGVSAPIPIFKPEPAYSEEARKAKLQGIVVLWMVIDATGAVTDCKVVKPLGKGLDEKAIEVVKMWKFKPALRNGTPVPVRVMVEVAFRL